MKSTKQGRAQVVHLAIFGFSALSLTGVALFEMHRNGWFSAVSGPEPEPPAWRFVERSGTSTLVNISPDEWECTEILQGEGSRLPEVVISTFVPKLLPEPEEKPPLSEEMQAWREQEADRLRRNLGGQKRYDPRRPQKWIPGDPSPEQILKERKRTEQNELAARVKARQVIEEERKRAAADQARAERRRKAIEEAERIEREKESAEFSGGKR